MFACTSRDVQSLDDDGIGGVTLLALGVTAETLVPSAIATKKKIERNALVTTIGGKRDAKISINRLSHWGLLLGGVLGVITLLLLPFLQVITPIKEVQKVAKHPSSVECLAQLINGLSFVGEGVMIGFRNFYN